MASKSIALHGAGGGGSGGAPPPNLTRAALELYEAKPIASGKTSIKYYPIAKPVVSEEVATQRCVAISEVTGTPIYIVHLSSERALRVAEAAQARGVQAYVETRILYVHLTEERFEGEDANIYIEPDVQGTLVQDCEVCCNPWRVDVWWEDGERHVTVTRGDGSE